MGEPSDPWQRHRRLASTVLALGATVVIAAGTAIAATPATSESPGPLATLPTVQIQLEPFAEGLTQPVFATGDGSGSGRLYAVEQGGLVRAISPDGTLDAEPFLDIREHVVFEGEQGLLGLAFHPDYVDNGRFFVDYVRPEDHATVISEFHAVDGKAAVDTERALLVIAQPFENHKGGMVAFDTTGTLLIGMGDGGGGGDPQGNGQDRASLLGKLLRIDVDGAEPYAMPTDAPFLGSSDTRPEIHALGLRNPWRFSVDPLTGAVFIGDVGQDTWEEVDVIPAGTGGQDFGWNIMEGPDCFEADGCDRQGLTGPVYSYGRGDGCTVIGGYVYRGDRYPELDGTYLFGDYCQGTIWGLPAAQAVAEEEFAVRPLGALDGSLVSFGQGDDGELYAVNHDGRILRVVVAPAG